MKISVVIRALNEEQHIGRLLTGIERQTLSAQEVIVVDSGSTDATVGIASHFGCTVVHIAPDEFSFGRSLNLGFEAAHGDIVVIPSAHVFPVKADWIAKLISPFGDERTALSYGRQIGGTTTRFSEKRVMAHWFPEKSDPMQEHPFANNANSAVRREVWEDHRYDETLTGLEDLDFAKHILDAGWNVSYAAEAVVVHTHNENWAQIRNRYRREAIAHRRVFNDQQMGVAETAKLIGLNVLGDLAAAMNQRISIREYSDIVRFRVAQFVGTFQGFRQSGPVTGEMKHRFYYPAPRRGSPEVPFATTADVIDYGEHSQDDERELE